VITTFVPVLAGAGATTAALACAASWASRSRVALIDLDPLGELGRRTGCEAPRPLADVYGLGPDGVAGVVPTSIGDRVELVPVDAGRYLGGGIACPVDVVRALADRLAATRDRVAIDAPPIGSSGALAALSVAQRVVLATPATWAGLAALPAALRVVLAQQNGANGPRLDAIVVGPTRFGEPSQEIAERIAACAASTSVAVVAMPFSLELARSAARPGRSWSPAPGSPLARAVGELVEALPTRSSRTGGSTSSRGAPALAMESVR
jgi:cellulose biosynthesis protein BcsQ